MKRIYQKLRQCLLEKIQIMKTIVKIKNLENSSDCLRIVCENNSLNENEIYKILMTEWIVWTSRWIYAFRIFSVCKSWQWSNLMISVRGVICTIGVVWTTSRIHSSWISVNNQTHKWNSLPFKWINLKEKKKFTLEQRVHLQQDFQIRYKHSMRIQY